MINQNFLQNLIDSLNENDQPTVHWVKRAKGSNTLNRKKIGIFSASFNPLTIAHSKMMQVAQQKFRLDEIILLLAKNNVDKSVFGFSLIDRLQMMAAYANPLDDYSVALTSHGRFIDKIKALKHELPVSNEYTFIIGYDTLIRIFDPKYYDNQQTALAQLFGQCRLIVANRQTFNRDEIADFLVDWPTFSPLVDIVTLDDFYTEISSTEIRQRLESKHRINHLVPIAIENFLATRFRSKPIKPIDN